MISSWTCSSSVLTVAMRPSLPMRNGNDRCLPFTSFILLICLRLHLRHHNHCHALGRTFSTDALADTRLRQDAGAVRLAHRRSTAPFDPDARLRLPRRYREWTTDDRVD